MELAVGHTPKVPDNIVWRVDEINLLRNGIALFFCLVQETKIRQAKKMIIILAIIIL